MDKKWISFVFPNIIEWTLNELKIVNLKQCLFFMIIILSRFSLRSLAIK